MTPGISLDVPPQDYHADPALNFSALKAMDTSALHYRMARTEQRKDTPSFALGRAAHVAVLEPETWDARYMLQPAEVSVTRERILKRRPKELGDGETLTSLEGGSEYLITSTAMEPVNVRNGAAWEAAKALAGEREILTESDWEIARSAAQSIRANPTANAILSLVDQHEITVVTKLRGVDVRARIDMTGPNILSELKSTRNITPDRFFRDVERFHYLAQLAWYYDLWYAVTNEKPQVKIIAVENDRPFDCMVVRFEDADIKRGRELYSAWLDRAIDCDSRQKWPGVADGCEVLYVDPYAEREIECST